MKTRTLTIVTLIAAALTSPAFAQYKTHCPKPNPGYGPDPGYGPGPVTSGFFLGVYTSSVPVNSGGSNPGDGPVAMIAPGYGETAYGQRVDRIVPGSPAFHAGLEPGDILISANGSPLESKQALVSAIQRSQGYMEMQVMDVRTGNLSWVVAEPEAPGYGPVAYSQQQPSSNRSFNNKRQPTQRFSKQTKNQNRFRNYGNPTQHLKKQFESKFKSLGGRRAPVRRRR